VIARSSSRVEPSFRQLKVHRPRRARDEQVDNVRADQLRQAAGLLRLGEEPLERTGEPLKDAVLVEE
jgi:hypothetical protein